jgi:hypothetical protein
MAEERREAGQKRQSITAKFKDASGNIVLPANLDKVGTPPNPAAPPSPRSTHFFLLPPPFPH